MNKFTKFMGNVVAISVISTVVLVLMCIGGLALLGALKIWGVIFGYE